MQEKEFTMTNMFKGYTNYSESEYKRIWENALIVVDANILLNFYRYSEDTRNSFFKVLEKLKGRLWIPYQVAEEFFNNKNNVMVNSYTEYDKLIKLIKNNFEESLKEINKRKNNQLNCKTEISDVIKKTSNQIEELLNKEKDEKKPNFNKNIIEENIFRLFDDCIGEPFNEEMYNKLKQEGIRRFEEKIPPGYKDCDKEENGDYYVFYALMDKSKKSHKDIIFITDDVKEDWFIEVNGEKHGGRYELLNEFYRETGNLLLIYTSDGFVQSYKKNMKEDFIDRKIIDELINVRNREHYPEKNDLIFADRNKDALEMLKSYRNYLYHNAKITHPGIILTDVSMIIQGIHSNYHKRKFGREFNAVINSNLDSENEMVLKDQLLLLIEKMIYYFENENNSNDYSKNGLSEILNNYKNCYEDLKNCHTKARQLKIYNELEKNVNEHIRLVSNSANNYVITTKLENFATEITNNILGDIPREKNKILRILESIIYDVDDLSIV